jgi:hypothetical protein
MNYQTGAGVARVLTGYLEGRQVGKERRRRDQFNAQEDTLKAAQLAEATKAIQRKPYEELAKRFFDLNWQASTSKKQRDQSLAEYNANAPSLGLAPIDRIPDLVAADIVEQGMKRFAGVTDPVMRVAVRAGLEKDMYALYGKEKVDEVIAGGPAAVQEAVEHLGIAQGGTASAPGAAIAPSPASQTPQAEPTIMDVVREQLQSRNRLPAQAPSQPFDMSAPASTQGYGTAGLLTGAPVAAQPVPAAQPAAVLGSAAEPTSAPVQTAGNLYDALAVGPSGQLTKVQADYAKILRDAIGNKQLTSADALMIWQRQFPDVMPPADLLYLAPKPLADYQSGAEDRYAKSLAEHDYGILYNLAKHGFISAKQWYEDPRTKGNTFPGIGPVAQQGMEKTAAQTAKVLAGPAGRGGRTGGGGGGGGAGAPVPREKPVTLGQQLRDKAYLVGFSAAAVRRDPVNVARVLGRLGYWGHKRELTGGPSVKYLNEDGRKDRDEINARTKREEQGKTPAKKPARTSMTSSRAKKLQQILGVPK